MERADRCRRAARDAVADVEPPRLQELLGETLANASMVPGVLAIETARRLGSETASPEYAIPEAAVRHAAGVQLIYEGLRLTRRLAHEEPWVHTDSIGVDADGGASNRVQSVDQRVTSDLEILAADILVARGFYLLARTDAAGQAVQTVQSFGRDQTRRNDAGADAVEIDANLERSVLDLAVLAGAATVDRDPTREVLALAADISDVVGTSFPPASECVPFEPSPSDPSEEPATTDRATSATDP